MCKIILVSPCDHKFYVSSVIYACFPPSYITEKYITEIVKGDGKE